MDKTVSVDFLGRINLVLKGLVKDFNHSIKQVSINGINWAALIALHLVTVPSLFGLMAGLTDFTPPVDMVLILWGALTLLYVKSIVERDIVGIVILGLGFIAQSAMMALVFFK
jgi:xanthine/uracil permease